MIVGNLESKTLIITETCDGSGDLPFTLNEGKLLTNILSFFNKNLLKDSYISTLITKPNIRPLKTTFKKEFYQEFYLMVATTKPEKIIVFSSLLDGFIENKNLALYHPTKLKTTKKKPRILEPLITPCVTLPTLEVLLKDTKLDKKGKKYITYLKIKTEL